jgi:hypothetical protein
MKYQLSEIKEILEMASQYELQSLDLEGIKVVFGSHARKRMTVPEPVQVPEKVTRAADAIEREADKKQKIDDDEEEFMELQLTDPAEYERRTLEIMRKANEEDVQ